MSYSVRPKFDIVGSDGGKELEKHRFICILGILDDLALIYTLQFNEQNCGISSWLITKYFSNNVSDNMKHL